MAKPTASAMSSHYSTARKTSRLWTIPDAVALAGYFLDFIVSFGPKNKYSFEKWQTERCAPRKSQTINICPPFAFNPHKQTSSRLLLLSFLSSSPLFPPHSYSLQNFFLIKMLINFNFIIFCFRSFEVRAKHRAQPYSSKRFHFAKGELLSLVRGTSNYYFSPFISM